MKAIFFKTIIILLLSGFYESVFSQEKSHPFPSTNRKEDLTAMGLIYNKPKWFSEEIGKHENFDENPILWEIFHLLLSQLRSEDNEYVVFFSLHNHFTAENIYGIEKANLSHLNNIRALIMASRYPGEYFPWAYPNWRSDATWKKELVYYPEKQARNKFNADTAIVFDILLDPKHAYQGKYTLVRNLVVQKNQQGSVFIHVFSKGEIKKKYWNQIEKMFYYGRVPVPRSVETNSKDSVVLHFKRRNN